MQNPKNKKDPQTIKLPIQTKHPRKTCTCGACDPPKGKLPIGTRLKIQPKYSRRLCYEETVPSIMLTGKWLQNQGFKCENYVIVTEQKGQLTIKIEKNNNSIS